MQARINRKKYNIYALDVESHNDEESIAKSETSIWLGCLIDETSDKDNEESYFYTIEELLEKLEILANPKRKHKEKKKPCKNNAIYVYNLSFEWSFILPVLLNKGFKFKENIEDIDEYVFNTISTKSVSSVWQINLKFNQKGGMIVFRDLAKIYGGGLGNVAKAFGLPTQKGEIDYRKNRLHNYQITQEEKYYCFDDTRIIIDILLEMIKREDKFFFGSLSMASYSMKMMIKTGYPRSMKPYAEYRKDYPELDEKESEFIRKSVSGGITYAPTRWQFKEINQKICHVDAHSMHPSSAFLNVFPYGFGEYFEGKPTQYATYLNCCRVRISYFGVKLHSVIQLIGLDFIDDYEITLWDFEIELMHKCYENLEVEYIDYYRYKTKPLKWRKYYSMCYNSRKQAKKEKNSFNVLYYKLLMNSSYGKALEKPHLTILENTIREDGIIDSIVSERVLKDDLKRYNAKYTYLPYGSCIPAYSRVALIELALKIGYEKVVYFDTDSIFFLWDKDTQSAWEKYANKEDFLGGWAIEEFIDRAQFTAPKRYKTETDGKATFKMGGFNLKNYKEQREKELGIDDYTIPYDEVNIVSSSWKVQRAFRCKGGTLIHFQDKEIQIPKKYLDIYERNMIE